MSEPEAPAKKGICKLPPPRKRDVVPFILAAVILLCGIVIGIGGTIFFLHYQVLNIIQHPEKLPDRITQLLQRHYSLNDEETEQVREILETHLLELEVLRQETRPRVDKELDAIRDGIAGVMGGDRGQVWTEDFERLRHQWLAPFVDLSDYYPRLNAQ